MYYYEDDCKKSKPGVTGSREQQSHVMPIQRKSSLRWVLLWWVDLSIGKDSINSASAKFRFRIIQTSVFYLPPPPVNSIPKTFSAPASFLLSLYYTEYSAGIFHHGNPSALLHSHPSYIANCIYLKRCPCSSGRRCGKFFLTLAHGVWSLYLWLMLSFVPYSTLYKCQRLMWLCVSSLHLWLIVLYQLVLPYLPISAIRMY